MQIFKDQEIRSLRSIFWRVSNPLRVLPKKNGFKGSKISNSYTFGLKAQVWLQNVSVILQSYLSYFFNILLYTVLYVYTEFSGIIIRKKFKF